MKDRPWRTFRSSEKAYREEIFRAIADGREFAACLFTMRLVHLCRERGKLA